MPKATRKSVGKGRGTRRTNRAGTEDAGAAQRPGRTPRAGRSNRAGTEDAGAAQRPGRTPRAGRTAEANTPPMPPCLPMMWPWVYQPGSDVPQSPQEWMRMMPPWMLAAPPAGKTVPEPAAAQTMSNQTATTATPPTDQVASADQANDPQPSTSTNGESNQPTSISVEPYKVTPLRSVASAMGEGISLSTKEKIWASKYVDFYHLLREHEGKPKTGKYKTVMDDDLGLVFQENDTRYEIRSPVTWSTAFLIFMSIFLEKHLTRAQQLLKYMHVVRQAAKDFPGFGWREYDRQFRLRQEKDPLRDWAELDGELWMLLLMKPEQQSAQARSAGLQNQQPNKASGSQVNSTPSERGQITPATNYCRFFNHANKSCRRSNCQYAHKCSNCGSPAHGAGSKKCGTGLTRRQ